MLHIRQGKVAAMRIPPRSRSVLVMFTAALLLTLVTPNIAVARVFRCTSSDVVCLIESIRSANVRAGSHTIILEAGVYQATTIDNTAGTNPGCVFDFDPPTGNAFPSITKHIAIVGAGPAETIITAAAGRLFHVGPMGTLILRNLTIQGGRIRGCNVAGGILSEGTLTIENSVVRDNLASFFVGQAGAIWSTGTLSIIDSQVTGNGAWFDGGIVAGTLRMVRSTVEGNSCEFGAGGIGAGSVDIEDSTITGNGGSAGGGLRIGTTGEIRNTTIAANFATVTGGGIFTGGTVRLTNVTIADNFAVFVGGGGVAVLDAGTVQIENTILADNVGGPTSPDCVGSLTSLGNNIFGDIAGCLVDLRVSDFIGDPRLGAFVEDGTPGHGHIPLLAESPAIDAANRKTCPVRDQLGHQRVDGDDDHHRVCDIGAVEFVP